MGVSEVTRFIRLRADVDRTLATNEGTRVAHPSRPDDVRFVDHHSLFNRHQRRLHQVLREFPRKGVCVFAVHPQHGLAGQLWLEASAGVRAGSVGRHAEVELHLPFDEALSLRQLLVLVTRGDGGTRIQVVDLATPGGFQAETGGVLRAVTADGPCVLAVASYSLFLLPTGAPTPWEPQAADPFLTLPPRRLVTRTRPRPEPRRLGEGQALVTECRGPVMVRADRLREPGEPVVACLTLGAGALAHRLELGASALERGVLLGRYERCAGDPSALEFDVSRVHALVLSVDGEPWLFDAGSTNGVFAGEAQVRAVPLDEVTAYRLASLPLGWQRVH